MEETYGVAIVHDFGDEYHLTDEEREAQNNYYKLFARLNKCKRKYRKINEYVDCARISLQCLQAVAENNTVYSTDEFMSMVMKEKIMVNGWFYPKYNGRDRKQLSWDYITEFILGDRPSEELLKQKSSDTEFLTEAELEEEAKAQFAQVREEGEKFLAENAKRANVVTLPSGLQYEIITETIGQKPVATDKVKVHYHGTLIDGTVFDSSVRRGEPATFGVTQVIQGWVEALQLMPVGSKWKLYIPYNLAYGENGAGQMIAPYSTLIFEVELLEIVK